MSLRLEYTDGKNYSAPSGSGLPATSESLVIKNQKGEALLTISDDGVGNVSISVAGNFIGNITGPSTPYAGAHSYQPVGVDLEVEAAGGSNTLTNPKFLSPIMGNILGDSLTNQANYLAGVVGAYSVTGSPSSDYPKAALMGVLFDGATDVDAIVLADLDGDDGGAATTAKAAFGVKVNNNNVGSGCDYGLSLHDAGNANYTGGGIPFTPKKADIQYHTGVEMRVFTIAITENVTTTDAPAGSWAITSHATGLGKHFFSDGSKWQLQIVS